MEQRKLVIGRREVVRHYVQDGRKHSVKEWVPFQEYVPLSESDLKQQAIDEATYQAQKAAEYAPPLEEVVQNLQQRIAALEKSRT
jgi:hypothetical protein